MAAPILPSLTRRFLLSALLLAQGCASGGGSAGASRIVPGPTATPQPISAKASVGLRIFVPSKFHGTHARRPAFVSPSTNGLVISVYASPEASNPTPLATATIDLSSASASCTASAGGRTCTVLVPAPVGTDDFMFTSYDEAPVGGAIPAGAHELAAATLPGLTVVKNVNNTFNVALGGVVSSIAIAPGFRSLDAAAAGSYPLGITAFDADGNMIAAGTTTVTNGSTTATDTYANPIDVSFSAAGAHVMLALNGGTPAASITVSRSSDTVTLSYDGSAASGYSATIAATASGATSASATFSPLFASPRSISFTTPGQSQAIALSETGFGGTFAASISNAGTTACPSGAITLGTIAMGATSSLTVSPGSSQASSCIVAISDVTTTVDVSVGVTQSAVTVVVPDRSIVVAGQSNAIETIDLDDPTKTSTLTVSVPGAPAGDQISVPAVVRDSAGTLYASVIAYSSGSGGSGSGAGGGKITFDADVLEAFPAGSSGAATPLATQNIFSCFARSLGIDRQGDVYAGCTVAKSIEEFSPGLPSVSPVATITGTGIPLGIAVDAAGNVAAFAGNTISFYPPPASGTQAGVPMRTISGSATLLENIGGPVAIDAAGNAYALSEDTGADAYEFDPQAVGNAAPSATFAIPGADDEFGGLAVDAAGKNLYVAVNNTDDGSEQIAVYSVTNPGGAPQTIVVPNTVTTVTL